MICALDGANSISFATCRRFSLVPWLVKVRPPHALPERMAGTQITMETFRELQNASELKQFSIGRYAAKRVYFLLGSSHLYRKGCIAKAFFCE